MFHIIDKDNWVRKEHFHAFEEMVQFSYTITSRIDVTNLVNIHHQENIPFYPMILYCLTKAVNQTQEFRMGKDENGNVGYWDSVDVNYTIFHKDDCSYSDVWTEYDDDFSVFYQRYKKDIDTYKDKKGLVVKPGSPENLLHLSSIPWIDFTEYSPNLKADFPMKSFLPAIEFGKYVEEQDRYKMSVSVQISHAAADGYHTAMYYQRLQAVIDGFMI